MSLVSPFFWNTVYVALSISQFYYVIFMGIKICQASNPCTGFAMETLSEVLAIFIVITEKRLIEQT